MSYAYGDSEWGDLLTAYGGKTITYDGIGNPLTDGTWTYTWEHGRQLASMSDGTSTWNYTYDSNGMRTKRTNGTTTYAYTYNGGRLTQMTMDENGTVRTLYFVYDADGPYALNVASGTSSTTYYYVKNAQGDITAIVNKAGTAVVQYYYDAWGNLLKIDGDYKNGLGIRNPLRYRGYVYDTETSLYYLQSRYYDPEMGRFINADGLITTNQGVIGYNLFAYCSNNPTMGYDPTGSTNWGGFWAGVAITAVGILGIAAIIMSAGTATPMVAAAMTATGTAVGTAVTATGVVTAYGAATEQPIVIDVSVSDGYTHDKHGYSIVVDFTSDSVALDGYYHYGKTNSGYSASYGVGLVDNYNNAGDYGGPFLDGGATYSCSGFDYGLDICTGPNEPFSDTTCSAAMLTVGMSFPKTKSGKVNYYLAYDYYVPIFYYEG